MFYFVTPILILVPHELPYDLSSAKCEASENVHFCKRLTVENEKYVWYVTKAKDVIHSWVKVTLANGDRVHMSRIMLTKSFVGTVY